MDARLQSEEEEEESGFLSFFPPCLAAGCQDGAPLQTVRRHCLQPSSSRAPALHPLRQVPAMPNFAGTWKMKSSENFDELLKVLGKAFFLSGGGGAGGGTAAFSRCCEWPASRRSVPPRE